MADRSNPVFIVRVIPPGGQPRILADVVRIISFAYEDSEKGSDSLTLQIDNFDIRLFDDPIFAHGNALEITWGYPGNMSPPRRCTIVKVTGFQTLTVVAHGAGIVLNKVTRVRAFQNMSRADVARQIAEESGYGPDLQDIEDTVVIFEQITQAAMTDAQLIRDLANREGFEYWIDFSGFHFHRRRLGQAPRRKFIWYIDPGQGDVLSIGIDNDVTGKVGAVVRKGIDTKTKVPFTVVADNSTTAGRPALAPVVGVPSTDNAAAIVASSGALTLAQASADRSIDSGPSLEASAEAAQREVDGIYMQSLATTVALSMTCIGDPQLAAKTVIEVSGIGARLSGNYYVITATHRMDPNGYTMVLKCRRDGTSSAITAAQAANQQSDGKVNKAKGPDEPSDDLVPVSGRDGTIRYKPAGAKRGAGS